MMRRILVFVNFIKSSGVALDQAIVFGRMHGSEISVCHISDGRRTFEELKKDLQPYMDKIDQAQLKSELILEEGAFFDLAIKIANRTNPDLVVMGTRGVEGYDMKLHGSAIYKLVSELPFSSLVFPVDAEVAKDGFHRIMLPISPHPKFLKKVRETQKVMSKEGEIILLSIIRDGSELDEDTKKNLEEAVGFLQGEKINHRMMELQSEKKSQSYAAITLDKVKEGDMDLVSIISNVSDRNKHFGKMEKEDILLNDHRMPVFCVNTAFEE